VDEINSAVDCQYMGTISNDNLPDILNKYETFITLLDHKTNSFHSFERTIVEAILCGMNIETNKEDFGLFSFPWDFTDPKSVAKELNKEYSNFWSRALKNIERNTSI